MKPLSEQEIARRLGKAAGKSAPDLWAGIEKRLDSQQYEYQQPVPRREPLGWRPLAAVAAVLVLTVGLLLAWPALKDILPVPSSSNGPASDGAVLLKEGDDYMVRVAGAAGQGNRLLDSTASAGILMTEAEAESRGDIDDTALKILEGYDEAFFDEYMVLVVARTEPSARFAHKVERVTLENGALTAVVARTEFQGSGEDVPRPFSLFIEIRKASVQGCNACYVEEDGRRELVQVLSQTQEIAFTSQAVLVGCPEELAWGPDIQILYSVEDLESYLESLGNVDFSSQMGMLSANTVLSGILESGFPDHPLAVIRIQEGDAQTRHRVGKIQGGEDLSVTLERLEQPSESEPGNYNWIIFVELQENGGHWNSCDLVLENHTAESPAYDQLIAPVLCVDEAGFISRYGHSQPIVETVRSMAEWRSYLASMGAYLDFSYRRDDWTSSAEEVHAQCDEAFFENYQLVAVTLLGNAGAGYDGLRLLYDVTAGTWLLSTGDNLPYGQEDMAGPLSWYQAYIAVPQEYALLPDELVLTDQLASYAWLNTDRLTMSAKNFLCADIDNDQLLEIVWVDITQNPPTLRIGGQAIPIPERTPSMYSYADFWVLDLDGDGENEIFLSLPTGGSTGETFMAAAKQTQGEWKLFPLPQMGEGVPGFQISAEALDDNHLAIICPDTGMQQVVELPYTATGAGYTSLEPFSISGASQIFELTADGNLRIVQQIWSDVTASPVAWLYTSFIFGQGGWTILDQYAVPDTTSQEEVSQPSQTEMIQ